MSSAESVEATVSIGEVAAMTDAQLAEFIQRHRHPNGDYYLPIDGWDKLSKDERSRLAERLEAQKSSLAQSPTACSRPLDLDDLDARLRQVSSDKSSSLRPENPIPYPGWSPTPPVDLTIRESEAYHELINDGGRPLYSINIIQDVFRDPDNYTEMLRPWQENITPISPLGIFQRQLQRWQDFRKWQNDNRGLEDDDGGYPAYLEDWKHIVERDILPRARDEYLAKIEADPSCMKSQWEQEKWARERQRNRCREHGCLGFREYSEAVKRRLARHGFTRPFKLDEDPRKQDKMATWIEYLNYEYWYIDENISYIERMDLKHDTLWQELFDKNILRPHETKEFMWTDASVIQRNMEKVQAEKALQQAKSETKRLHALTQEAPKWLRIPQAKRILILERANNKLRTAERQLEQAKTRLKLLRPFGKYTAYQGQAKRFIARHQLLVQWVLEQIPHVDAEVNPSKANRLESDKGRRSKRRRTTDEEPLEGQHLKRVRFDLPESSLASSKARSKAIETRAEPGTIVGKGATHVPQPENPAASDLQRNDVRRSARIAARRNAPSIALKPDISRPRAPSRSNERSAQPRISNSAPQDAHAFKMVRRSRRIKEGGIAKSTPASQKRQQRRRK